MAGYAASLEPIRTTHPGDNTAAPAADRYTNSDDEGGCTVCEPVTGDGLDEAVDRDDQSDHNPSGTVWKVTSSGRPLYCDLR